MRNDFVALPMPFAPLIHHHTTTPPRHHTTASSASLPRPSPSPWPCRGRHGGRPTDPFPFIHHPGIAEEVLWPSSSQSPTPTQTHYHSSSHTQPRQQACPAETPSTTITSPSSRPRAACTRYVQPFTHPPTHHSHSSIHPPTPHPHARGWTPGCLHATPPFLSPPPSPWSIPITTRESSPIPSTLPNPTHPPTHPPTLPLSRSNMPSRPPIPMG